MARKRHSDQDILKLLREIEVKLAEGNDVPSSCRSVGISDATYYKLAKWDFIPSFIPSICDGMMFC